MRIAICLTGQMRTALFAFPSIQHFLGDLLHTADFFIHTWTVDTEKSVYGDHIHYRKEIILTQQNLDNYINLYQPKRYKIDNWLDVTPNTSDGSNPTPEYCKMYSIIKCIQMKKEYEIAQNFTYDLVIKIRPDFICDPALSIYDIINHNTFTTNSLFTNDIVNNSPDDVLWFANSVTMDKISRCPLSEQHRPEDYWHVFSSWYLRINHIESKRFSGEIGYDMRVISDKWSILRSEAIPYNPVVDYKKCLEIDRHIYWEPTSSLVKFTEYMTLDEWKTLIKKMSIDKLIIPPHLKFLL